MLSRIIDAAHDIPILFAAVSSTGFVLFEEFTNADHSLSWIPALSSCNEVQNQDSKEITTTDNHE